MVQIKFPVYIVKQSLLIKLWLCKLVRKFLLLVVAVVSLLLFIMVWTTR